MEVKLFLFDVFHCLAKCFDNNLIAPEAKHHVCDDKATAMFQGMFFDAIVTPHFATMNAW
jgi:hypothetical protein